MNVTALEQDFLDAFCEGTCMYLEHLQGYCDEMKEKQTAGVVSSLIKKGLITRGVDKEFNMEFMTLTDSGMKLSKHYKED